MQMDEARALLQRAIDQVETVIVGKRSAVEHAFTALLANGHLLIEDVPGTGKTMLARSMARCIDGSFRRIQFTPDLLPADITGTAIYNQKTSEFEFRPGPVFANIVLADEVNRATPKTQSSLLEAMEEFQVTADGVTRPLPRPFFVIATQNSVEYQGTFPLPESQLDRFALRIRMGYPTPADEVRILDRQSHGHPIDQMTSVLTSQQVEELRAWTRAIHVAAPTREYIVDLVNATRESPELMLGSSLRGSLDLLHSSQVHAAMQGRDHVLPDDVKALAEPVLAHRLLVHPEARLRKVDAETVIRNLLRTLPVPVMSGAS